MTGVVDAYGGFSPFPLDAAGWTEIAAGAPLPILAESADVLVGINTFEPGEEFANHSHRVTHETFVGIKGEVELWVDRSEPILLGAGSIRTVLAPHEHYLRNVSDESATIVYIKTPNIQDDRHPSPWSPQKSGNA